MRNIHSNTQYINNYVLILLYMLLCVMLFQTNQTNINIYIFQTSGEIIFFYFRNSIPQFVEVSLLDG